jgi:hypothetical protein
MINAFSGDSQVSSQHHNTGFALFRRWAKVQDEHKTVIEKFIEKHGLRLIGQGRHRRTYLSKSGKYVVKLPINNNGEDANQQELNSYQNNPQNKARCRLIWIMSKPVLLMEVVQPWWEVGDDIDTLPDWVRRIDAYQAGYNRKNKLVAWDYAEEEYSRNV